MQATKRWGALLHRYGDIDLDDATAIAGYAIAGLLSLIEDWQSGRRTRNEILALHVRFVLVAVADVAAVADPKL